MPTPSGFSNQKMRGPARHQTVQTMGSDRVGIPTAQMYLYEKTPVAINIVSVELTATTKQTKRDLLTEILIEFDGPHNAAKFDILRMLDGVLEGWEFEIIKVVDATHLVVYNIADIEGVEQLPEVGDSVKTLRWTTALSDQSGALQVSQGPLQFVRDSATTEVNEDTVDPTNNRPLPSGMYILIDGVAHPVGIDTGTPANTVMVPVQVSGVSGPINITAGDLNVQLSSEGANFDATRIGDGSGVYLKIEADGSITSNNPDVVTALSAVEDLLTTLVGVDFATEAKQDDTITELQTLNTVDFATEAKQDAIITELQALSSSGLATEAKQDDIISGIGDVAGSVEDVLSELQNGVIHADIGALSAKFGTLGQKASAGSAPVVLSTEQETILSSLATKLDTLITSNAAMVTSNASRVLDSVVNIITTTVNSPAPANAKGFIIQNSTASGGNLRWGKAGATVNATNGFYLGQGQSTSYINGAGNIQIFDVDGAGLDAAIVWFT